MINLRRKHYLPDASLLCQTGSVNGTTSKCGSRGRRASCRIDVPRLETAFVANPLSFDLHLSGSSRALRSLAPCRRLRLVATPVLYRTFDRYTP
jgi:hypothetical protein